MLAPLSCGPHVRTSERNTPQTWTLNGPGIKSSDLSLVHSQLCWQKNKLKTVSPHGTMTPKRCAHHPLSNLHTLLERPKAYHICCSSQGCYCTCCKLHGRACSRAN